MTETPTENEVRAEGDVWSRRSYIRYLAPLSVAVPILVEGRTLVGLVNQDFGGGDTAWTQPTGVDVGIGGELRPDTPTREKLRNAALGSDGTLTLAVGVRNTANAPYEFAIGAVTTSGGETVQGGATSSRLAPGGTDTFQASYDLPKGATPGTVDTTVTVGNQVSQKTVTLAPIPGTQ